MIINFSFLNFRSVKKEVTLSFEASNSNDLEDYYIVQPNEKLRLLKLGIIYGANASGKTNVLKALDFLRKIVVDPSEKKTDKIKYDKFLFSEKTRLSDSEFKINFISQGVRYFYHIFLNNKAIVKETLYFYNPNKALVYSRTTDLEKQTSKIDFGSKIKISKEHRNVLEANTLWNNTVIGGYLKTNFNSINLQNVVEWFQNYLKPLITPRTNLLTYISSRLEEGQIRKEKIIDILKMADFKISDILIKKDPEFSSKLVDAFSKFLPGDEEKLEAIKKLEKIEGKVIAFEHTINTDEEKKSYSLKYQEESQGTQRYYQFAGLLDLMIQGGKIFIIDELETSLHPDLIKHFILTFLVNVKNSQLILASHYRELLAERDIIRKDIIWFTEKGEDGSTDLYSLCDFDTSVIRSTSSIYNAYKIGKLGAVPTFDDYYLETQAH